MKRLNLVYQIKITIGHIEPPIWRRVQLQASTNVGRLHDLLQEAFDWNELADHRFIIDGKSYGEPGKAECCENDFSLHEIAADKSRFGYQYGDWEIEVLVENTHRYMPNVEYPICYEGERAGPPEDCGGPAGYQKLLEAGEFAPDDFDPEYFDADETTKLIRMGRENY